jgi:hypothetical protein
MKSIIPQPATPSKKVKWAGRVMSALPVLLLVFSAGMKFMKPPAVLEGLAHFGIAERLVLPLGVLEITCTIIYLIPQASVLGAILLTGYLGGATMTHLRVGEPVFMPVLVGVLVWGGLFLREPRLWALIPFRRTTSSLLQQEPGSETKS